MIKHSLLITKRNQKETLTQNYRRLGLSSKLNAPTGGTEKTGAILEELAAEGNPRDTLGIQAKLPRPVEIPEVRVERDPETGAILRVIEVDNNKPNPLNDPLNALDDSEDEEWNGFSHEHGVVDGSAPSVGGKTAVVRELEEAASRAAPKVPRKQSGREGEWIQDLVEKYGDDYLAMSRDMRLNPMQQTVGDLKKRVKKFKSNQV